MAGWLSERSRNGSVDEIALPTTATITTTGRLWLCGKHFIGPDPEGALRRTGADVVVCLNEPSEIEHRYPGYVAWLRANEPGRAVWFPIPDLHAPPAVAVRPLLDQLLARMAAGDGVLVTCGAGVGRAGTIAAGLLLAMGTPLGDALAIVGAHRPTAGPQTSEQTDLLAALAEV